MDLEEQRCLLLLRHLSLSPRRLGRSLGIHRDRCTAALEDVVDDILKRGILR